MIIMKLDMARMTGIMVVAVVVAVAMVGCGKEPESPGVGERTGAALDKAAAKTVVVATNVAEKTTEVAKKTAAATKDAAGKAVEKTGEAMEKAGGAVEKTGENMQK
jgi:uncharacterized lipoprotein YehR (DUF1307 family)